VPTLRKCGVVALQMQGDVSNVGKEVSERQSDSERLKRMREAKTKIDEVIQDLILIEIEEFKVKFSIDAEEVSFLNPKEAENILHENILVIDPIDGTLEYLEGKDNYSICIGWHFHGQMQAAIVYFPAHDKVYFCTDTQAYIVTNFLLEGLKNIKILNSFNDTQSQQIYL